MQNEFQPEENQTPLTAKPAASLATETEADTQAVADITKRLDEITHRSNRASRGFNIRYGVLCGGIAALIFLPFRSLGVDNPLFFPLMLLLMTVSIILFMLTDLTRAKTMPGFDVAEITRLGGVKAISPLFAAMQNPMPYARKCAIEDAITFLLPQLKASDAHLITPALRRSIHANIYNASIAPAVIDRRIARCIAEIKALEQVGDASAVPVVEKLTQMKPRTLGQEKIKQAAIECLPMLLMNCGGVEAARTLLRASHSEAARPDTLLRPASGAGQTAAQELLRPSDEESGP